MVELCVAQLLTCSNASPTLEPLVSRDLHGPILVDANGLPRYWATVWSTLSTAQLADSTHIRKLRCIEGLYQHADNLLGASALDNALGSLDDEVLSRILESWFMSLRNHAAGTKNDEVLWQTGTGFVFFVIAWMVENVHDANHRSLAEELDQIEIGDEKATTVAKMITAGKANGPIVASFRRMQRSEGDTAALHATSYGHCLNSFNVDPCPKHLECFSGCRHLSATDLPENRENLIRLEGKLKGAIEMI